MSEIQPLVPNDKKLRVVRFIRARLQEDPYISTNELGDLVMDDIANEYDIDYDSAYDIYAICSMELQGYLESGPKLAQCDAILDDVIKKCKNGLTREVEVRAGEFEDIVDDRLANTLLKAVDTKMRVLNNMQSSLIAAKRAEDENQVANDTLDLLRAEADELKANLKGNVLANPALAAMVLERRRMKDAVSE